VKPTQGISAISSAFNNFLKLAKYLNLIPIYPNFVLSGHHNYGKPTNFLTYIELTNYIHREPDCDSTNENTLIWKVENEWMLSDNFYKQYIHHIQNIEINSSFTFKKEFESLGKTIIETFEKPICCVHVRRTDYLKRRPSLNITTTAYAILLKLKSLETPIATLYIMTDEPDPQFFDSIKSEYNVKLYLDIPQLVELKKEDNYKLFLVESYIRDKSDLRISTFRSIRKNYYITYLDEIEGWQ
jgi:hypothetical protein